MPDLQEDAERFCSYSSYGVSTVSMSTQETWKKMLLSSKGSELLLKSIFHCISCPELSVLPKMRVAFMLTDGRHHSLNLDPCLATGFYKIQGRGLIS